MSFWTWLTGRPNHAGVTANDTVATPESVGGASWNPGDPEGVMLEGFDDLPQIRALPSLLPSPWDGWPADWNVPNWDFGSRFNELVDVAWTCLDLNSSVLSAMPVYRTRGGVVIEPTTWMSNPDPSIYTSWLEFAKQLFWDFQMGEAFVMSVARSVSTELPLTFRVVPPWMMHVEMRGGRRAYRMGGPAGVDVTEDVLHVRYKSTTDGARGVGPLEVAGGRMLTAGVLAKYVREVATTGGVPNYTLETDTDLSPDDAQDLLQQWVTARQMNLAAPPVLDRNVQLKTHFSMSPKDMAMLELSQFTESRIAVMLGVPPFLVGLPSGGSESMTYSNVSQIFDYHDRASLRPKAAHVMAALSDWALPSTQRAELNRDEYSRPTFELRAAAWVELVTAGIVRVDEVRTAERLQGDAPAAAIVGAAASSPPLGGGQQ